MFATAPSKYRVLVVEDDPGRIAMLERCLDREEIEVRVLGDPALLRQRIEREDYILILVSLACSPGRRRALMEDCRKFNHEQPFIVLTEEPSYEELLLSMQKGALDYFQAPFDENRIRELLIQHLTRIASGRDVAEVDRYIRFKRVRLEIPSDLGILPNVAQRVTNDVLAAGVIAARQAYLVSLALYEILTNALEHGNLGISYDEKTRHIADGTFLDLIKERSSRADLKDRQIRIQYTLGAHGATIDVIDEGAGFDVGEYERRIQNRSRDSYHGRGIILARNLVSRVIFRGRGNIVRLCIEPDSAAP